MFGRSEFEDDINVDGKPADDDDDCDDDNYDDVDNFVDEENNDELHLTVNTVNELNGIKHRISGSQHKDFIARHLEQELGRMESENELTYDNNGSCNNKNSNNVKHNYENVKELQTKIKTGMKAFNPRQKEVVKQVKKYFNLNNDPEKDQLIMFLSGEGGTGKTTVIKMLCDIAKVECGRLGGPHDPLLCMAPTGSAANTIDGFTHQSIFHCKDLNMATRNISSLNAAQIGGKLKGNCFK
jgi:signal recognition particle GTPase